MQRYSAYVTNVYDGDTITADIDLGFGVLLTKQKLRLADIRAPEIRGENREAGLVTRDALRSRIDCQWITIETDNYAKGKYGRWLVNVYIGDECLNEWLVTSGHATRWSRRRRP